MKRKIILVFAVIFILFGSKSVFANSNTGHINISGIGLLYSPNYSSNVVTKLSANDSVEIISTNNNWLKVKTEDNKVGWVSSYFINRDPKRYVKITINEPANLRTGPSVKTEKVGQANPGDKLEYIRTFHSWYQVKYNGKKVYVASWLGDVISDGKTRAILIMDKVNIRNKPSTDGTVLKQARLHEGYQYLGEKDGWVKVRINDGSIGYIAGWLVSFDNNLSLNTTMLYRKKVTVNGLNFRQGPSVENKSLGLLNKGDVVRILSSNGNWDKIITPSGKVAYSHNSYLKPFKSLLGKTIVVDPGHGGYKTGTKGYRKWILEKNINLTTAMKLRTKLRELGASVIMLRTNDRHISIYDRAAISERIKPDAFISVHHNALPDTRYFGASTYYNTTNNRLGYEGKKLAKSIYGNITSINGVYQDGVYDRRFVVIREQNYPATLVEIGFLSNPWEEKNVHLPSFVNTIATKIAQGVENYLYKE